MHDLRRVFEDAGCDAVTTYIQSGNVLFESKLENTTMLSVSIERALATEFARTLPVLVLGPNQLGRVVRAAPAGFGDDPAGYRYDVVFVKPPLRARLILPTIRLKDGVDEVFEGNEVLYLKKLTVRAGQSQFSKLTQHSAYGSMTVRNWKTTTELYRLIASRRR